MTQNDTDVISSLASMHLNTFLTRVLYITERITTDIGPTQSSVGKNHIFRGPGASCCWCGGFSTKGAVQMFFFFLLVIR